MTIQHKAVGVSGIKSISEDDGIIRAIVSVTGIRDNVNDIILPGAYEKSLKTRTPKGVWHHNWHESISRTLSIKELLPGDPELPKEIKAGEPWPSEAGALMVETQFNLKTTRGREAYEDVKFFGDEQEWSIGYNVPVGGATVDSKSGVRKISTLDLYEYSPVLFGAMPNARTSSVKDAQTAYNEIKSLHGDEAGKFLMEIKSIVGEQAFTADREELESKGEKHREQDQGGLDAEDDWEEDVEDEDEDTKDKGKEEKSGGVNVSVELIRNAIAALNACLVGIDGTSAPSEEGQEEKSYGDTEAKDLSELLGDEGYDQSFMTLVKAFDSAVESADVTAMEEAATPILDFVEAMVDMDGDEDGVKDIADYVAQQFKTVMDDDDDEDLEDEDEEELDEDSEESDVDEDADDSEEEEETKSSPANIEMKSISWEAIQAALSDV